MRYQAVAAAVGLALSALLLSPQSPAVAIPDGDVAPLHRIALPAAAPPATQAANPADVAVHAGFLYVADPANDAIEVHAISSAGLPDAAVAARYGPEHGLAAPVAMAFDPAGDLLVANRQGDRVTRHPAVVSADPTADLAPLAAVSVPSPRGLAVDSQGRMLVSSTAAGTDQVLRFRARWDSAGEPQATLAGANTDLDQVRQITVTSDDTLLVVNAGSDAITAYPAAVGGNRAPSHTLRHPALVSPTDVTTDPVGRLVVTVRLPQPGVVRFPADWRTGGSQPDRRLSGASTTLAGPTSVAVDGAGRVVVADPGPAAQPAPQVLVFPAAAPTMTAATPLVGPRAGGTQLTVSGSEFLPGATVAIGDVACGGVRWVDPTTITCTTGSAPAGRVAIWVTNPDGQFATIADTFRFLPGPFTTPSPQAPVPLATSLRIQARSQARPVRGGRSVRIVPRATTNGRFVVARAVCRKQGRVVSPLRQQRVCGLKVRRSSQYDKAQREAGVAVTAAPARCVRNADIRVTLHAQRYGAATKTWHRTWRIATNRTC